MLGKFGSASFFALGDDAPIGSGLIGVDVGATKKARPCRPVKPFETTCSACARSDRQREHRKREECTLRYVRGKSPGEIIVGAIAALLSALVFDTFESVLDLRRRKLRDGTI